MGVQIITPSSAPPAANPASGADNFGLKPVGPPNATPLPPIEKPSAAPDAVNDIQGVPQPAAQQANANGKKTKPAFDKSDESSSKHPKKKGLKKINPF